MNRIKEVKALDNYEILVTFDNGEKRIKDMKPYLNKWVLRKIKNKDLKSVKELWDSGYKLNNHPTLP